MKRFALSAMALTLTVFAVPRLASAAYHVSVIDEVVTSFGGDDTVQFVEIRMLIANQKIVSGAKIGVFDATGAFVGATSIGTNLANDGADVRWIVGTASAAALFGVPMDFTLTTLMPTAGGMVCFGKPSNQMLAATYDVDCLAYGTYSGTVPPSAGTATSLDGIGHSLQRDTNTGNNANDFICGDPSNPQNNAGTTNSLSATTACPPPPTATATPTPAITCPATPMLACKTATPGKSSFQISKRSDPAKRKMSWKWSKGEATAVGLFGDPTTTASYVLCGYNGTNTLILSAYAAAGGMCDGKVCWKASGNPPKGYKYKSKSGFPYGVSGIGLTEGVATKAKVSVTGKGNFLTLPALPISSLPLKVQLLSTSGTCWTTTFSSALSDPAETEKFKAKND